jgi:hypothetical protein
MMNEGCSGFLSLSLRCGFVDAVVLGILKALKKLETRWDVTKEDGAKEGEMETQLIDKEGEGRKSNTYIWGERQSHSPHMECAMCRHMASGQQQ